MPSITSLRRFAVVALCAGAMLCASASFDRAFAFPSSGPTLTETAAKLGNMLGNSITIHVTPDMEGSPVVPAVCKVVIEALHDVTRDEQSRERLRRLLDVVVIEGQKTTLHEHFVTLKEHTLTIQTVNDASTIPEMRSLLDDVLKKLVGRDEKMEPLKQ